MHEKNEKATEESVRCRQSERFTARATCNELLMFDENTLCDDCRGSTGAHALGQRGQNVLDE
jgi:hypothetical protein